MTTDDLLLADHYPPGPLASRLAERGLAPDYTPLDPDVIDLRSRVGIDVDHLLAEHRAACDELRGLRLEVTILRSVITAVLEDVPDEFGETRARPYPQLDPAQAAAVERAMGEQ